MLNPQIEELNGKIKSLQEEENETTVDIIELKIYIQQTLDSNQILTELNQKFWHGSLIK